MECGKPVTSGQFLCSDCAARKTQPKTQPSAVQPVYYPPPKRNSNKAWTVSAVLAFILGVGWFGTSSLLKHRAAVEEEAKANVQRQEQAQREAELLASREREQAESLRRQQAQEAAQRAFQDAQRRAQAQTDSQRRQARQGRSDAQSSSRIDSDYSFASLVARFDEAIVGADMAFSSFNGVGADAYVSSMTAIAQEMEQLAPYTSQSSRNQQIAKRALQTSLIYMNRVMRQQSGGAIQ